MIICSRWANSEPWSTAILPVRLVITSPRAVTTGCFASCDGVMFVPLPGIRWLQGNAECLPVDDGCYDAYTIAFGIRNCTTVKKVGEYPIIFTDTPAVWLGSGEYCYHIHRYASCLAGLMWELDIDTKSQLHIDISSNLKQVSLGQTTPKDKISLRGDKATEN